jgi:hypothetical protein
VPLSDHEQRLLSEMEQQLVADDPKFASAMQGSRTRSRAGSRLAIGGLAVVAGMVLLVLSVAYQRQLGIFGIPLSVLAFIAMLAGASYAFSRPAASAGPQGVVGQDGRTVPRAGRPPKPRTNRGIMERFEERWARRRGESR